MMRGTLDSPKRTGAITSSALMELAWKHALVLTAFLRRRSVASARDAGRTSGDSPAHAAFLACAEDASDLERRQRAWERTESNAYSLSNWS
jgi:hypothetical protein